MNRYGHRASTTHENRNKHGAEDVESDDEVRINDEKRITGHKTMNNLQLQEIDPHDKKFRERNREIGSSSGSEEYNSQE